MAQAEKDSADTSSIEAVLRSLSTRPNVQCTLILARNDGSIIKSTGFKEVQPVVGASHQDYKDNATETTSSADGREASVTSSPEQVEAQAPTLSPAERLASSIYSFMRTADNLASAAYSPEVSADLFSATKTSEQTERDQNNADDDTDVQLLRMRTRRQEIIIFPDTKYLCCVVQNTSRGGNADGGR